ncbi:hypothetical protein [Hymenobacter defluvii]|uniref:CBM-cenC domain-containing protein n=1 Tax=Hymenobacter defluvii TaxID=2054411 RepID=A0ABS3TE13_9BACT|nr:hypothetical protein [Hymenobacter defluvii]MBO3271899.1 hypothetical protein [Hymenobacter defluvii]
MASIGLVLAMTACKSRPAHQDDVHEYVILDEDFEQLGSWLTEPAPTLTKERAHSGRYAVKVDKEHPYSITYRLTLNKAFKTRPHRVRLSAWVWVARSSDQAQLVFSLNSPTSNTPPIFTTRIYIGDNWPFKRWVHLSRDIDLPPEFSSESQIVIYLWHCAAQNPVFADDWKLIEIH